MVASFLTALAHPTRAIALMVAVIVGGCGGAPGAPGAASSPPASPGPTAGPPTSFADWVERDGYNGDSTLRQIKKNGDWMVAHVTEETQVYIDQDIDAVARLVQWLDLHPATACWADYHVATRQSLGTIQGYFATLRLDVAAGQPLPFDIVNKVGDEANTAFNRPAPTTCP